MKRALIALAVIAAICFGFWLFHRDPVVTPTDELISKPLPWEKK